MSTKGKAAKVKALLEESTLNPTPEKVRDLKFRENEFFDPRDLVQVKYEMLRRVSIEKASVTDATEEYGVSRPTYYQTKANFDKAGVAGLVPQKRGPHGPHKFQGEALAFVQQQLVAGEPVRACELAKLVRQKFNLTIHPRTNRAGGRWKKNFAMTSARSNSAKPSIASRNTRLCAGPPSATRCLPRPVPGSCSFSLGACGDGRGRCPP